MTPSVEAEVQTITRDRFGERAITWCREISRISSGHDAVAQELQLKFNAPLEGIREVAIAEIDPAYGAFKVEGGRLTLAMEPVVRLMTVVVRDPNVAALSADQVIPLLDKVLLIYLLHEVRHRSQGVENYANVKLLKKIAGPASMSEIDVLADRDAAFAYAVLHAHGGKREDYLAAFQEAIWFSITYYFKAFPLLDNRIDKMARVCAIYLMAARLAVADLQGNGDSAALPLDAPLLVRLNGLQGVTVFRAEPSLKLMAADDNSELIPSLLASANAGDPDEALKYASQAVMRFRLAA